MGNTDSVLIEEKSNWKKPHELIYNTELRNKQISQLQEFGKDLKICFFTRQLPRVNFQHWYVTDGKWVMEFGHTRLVMETVIGQVTHGAQLWKYDNIAAKNRQGSVRNVKRIVNKTITDEDHSKDWILPKEGEVGYIEKSFGEVLGLEYVSYYKTNEGRNVILQSKRRDVPAKEQMWLRSTNDSNGWFTLRNLASGKFLTAVGSNSDPGQWKLTIQDPEPVIGMSISTRKNPKGKHVIVEGDFTMTKDVKTRMEKLCGATNFSLGLRNSEHAARFIQTGCWMSYQMIGDANLNKYLGMENRQDINTLPRELEEKAPSQEILYQTIANSHEVKYYNDASKLTDAEKGCYNVVVLGPTGCGKSTIVNQIFNKSVCPTGANAFSVTREIRFYHGRCERLKKMINIIDTVGFCDSDMSRAQVFDAIKDRVEVNVAYVDKVIIICSGRIEAVQVKAIKQCMEWLQFKNYKQKFSFIYNKSDQLTDAEKINNLGYMCEKLDADLTTRFEEKRDGFTYQTKLNQPLGFPRDANYEEVKNDLKNLMAITLAETPERICFDKQSGCTIL